MKLLSMVIAALLLAGLLNACYYDKADLLYPGSSTACDTSVTAKFSSEVLPVMNASCNQSGCHNTSGASGGVILDTYAGVKAAIANGRLTGSLNQSGSYSAMPKGGSKLNTCTITKIQQWINAGAQNN